MKLKEYKMSRESEVAPTDAPRWKYGALIHLAREYFEGIKEIHARRRLQKSFRESGGTEDGVMTAHAEALEEGARSTPQTPIAKPPR